MSWFAARILRPNGRSRRRWLALSALLAMVTMPLAAPGAAHAYVIKGRAWPGGVVRYHSSLPASANWQIAMAARAWNTSGARVRFVRVSNPRRAQLRIRYGRPSSGSASATLGYRRNAVLLVRRPRRARVDATQDRVKEAQLFAHEFGHVLGLHHTRARGCALMAQYLSECLDNARRPWQWNCRMLRGDDLRGAIRLYGRARPTRRRAPTFCLRAPAPPQLQDVRVSGGSDGPVTVHWRTPRRLAAGSRIELSVYASTCSEARSGGRSFATGLAGFRATQWTDADSAGYAPGSYCYRVQVSNRFGLRRGAIWRDATVTQSPPAAPVFTGLLTEYPDELTDYRIGLELPTSGTQLEGRYAPPGACAATLEQGEPLRVAGPASPYPIDGPPPGHWCLSFFAVRMGVASAATTLDVVHAERPA